MTPAELNVLSDQELSELFAVEVAGWFFRDQEPRCHHGSGEVPWGAGQRTSGKRWECNGISDGIWHRTKEDATLHARKYANFPMFATSADAVLPWIAHYEAWTHETVSPSEIAEVTVKVNSIRISPTQTISGFNWFGRAPTFARAAVIALLQAARAAKGVGA